MATIYMRDIGAHLLFSAPLLSSISPRDSAAPQSHTRQNSIRSGTLGCHRAPRRCISRYTHMEVVFGFNVAALGEGVRAGAARVSCASGGIAGAMIIRHSCGV